MRTRDLRPAAGRSDDPVEVPIEDSDYPVFSVRRASFRVLSCGRVRLHVHASLLVYTLASVLITLAQPPREVLLAAIVQGPVLWASVLVHELGKVLAALALGVDAGDVILWPAGGLTLVGGTSNLKKDIAIACMGPLSHIPVILSLYAVIRAGGYKEAARRGEAMGSFLARRSLFGAMWMNVGLCALNCVAPAFPMDIARVVVDLQVLTRATIEEAAGILVFATVPAVPMLLVFGLYAIQEETEMSVVACALALWVGLQARTMLYCRQLSMVHDYPLFKHMRPHAAQPAPAAAEPVGGAPTAARGPDAATPGGGEVRLAQVTLAARPASGALDADAAVATRREPAQRGAELGAGGTGAEQPPAAAAPDASPRGPPAPSVSGA